MSNGELAFLIVIATLILSAIIAIALYVIIHKKHIKIVEENSKLYGEILKLNASYHFYSDFSSEYSFYEDCSSKRKLETLSLYDVLLSTIGSNQKFFEKLLVQIQKNIQNYKSYCIKYDKLLSKVYEYDTDGLKIKQKTFIKIEKDLCDKIKLKPKLFTIVTIHANYTSPQGRNSYNREEQFRFNALVNAYDDYIRIKNSHQEYQYTVKTERAKMTDSLRYDILKRDGFRCQLCGATAKEGAKLHVDHIIPVSKGGKTVASNLRTLCDRCNMGKSDKIE